MDGEGILRNRLTALVPRATLLWLIILTALAGGASGLFVALALDNSEYALIVAQLSDYRASVLTRVYADDDRTVIGEFYLERRIPVTLEEITPQMRQAFIAVEDARFYEHYGLDPIRIVGAFLTNLREGRTAEGGSTITQQLTKQLFLTPERTYSRKIKEILLALLVERYYTKEQILELYCNQIYLGGNAYGVEAASQYYFSKSAKDLAIEECAMLAALPKGPQNYSPVLHPRAALQRRNRVLQGMIDEGYITEAEGKSAMERSIRLSQGGRIDNIRSPFAYLVEEVRQQMENRYGTRTTHTGGLRITTTLDAGAQIAAARAVRVGLHAYDRRHGWRGGLENILDQRRDLQRYRHPDWEGLFEPKEYYTGLVMSVDDRQATVRFGSYKATVTPKDAAWGRPLRSLVRPGDLTIFQVQSVNDAQRQLSVKLLQRPAIQGALVALDVTTGEIKAMVGGYDFNTSKFNHATQGERQTGSVFKPFIYAAAVEYGIRPEDIVLDTPFERGSYKPSNYDGTFKGPITVATALALSRNIPAIRTLDHVGIARTARMVDRLGLPNPMAPFLPSALGATEEPLLDMVSAYSVFAQGGRRAHPHFIRKVVDRDGRELEHWEDPKPETVISAYVASTMVELMKGSVQSGTSTAIRGHRDFDAWEIAGKTGTVNDFTDAWFIGYTPLTCTGVWIGYDEKKSLGNRETGAVAALPVWIDFMKAYVKGKKPKRFPDPKEMPEELVKAREERGLGFAPDVPPDSFSLPIPEAASDVNPLAADPGSRTHGGSPSRLSEALLPKKLPIPPKPESEPERKKPRPGRNG
ncbi:MAG: PBP1A family penicillin-binding protein [Acidobacteria bacterium]|nr:PBP1A family penicillin-binding protein [Acidobacteriota bacterium]